MQKVAKKLQKNLQNFCRFFAEFLQLHILQKVLHFRPREESVRYTYPLDLISSKNNYETHTANPYLLNADWTGQNRLTNAQCTLVAVFVVNDCCVQTKISLKKENKLSIFIMDSINQTALMDSLNQTAIMEVEDYEFNSFLFWLGLFGLYIVFGIFLSFTMPIVVQLFQHNTGIL